MRGSIRKTDFTWDPTHQSRQVVWNALKAHIRSELDRIEEASKQHARRQRLIESPNYERDRAIYHEHQVRGTDAGTLARMYGLSRERIREILRVARYRERVMSVKPRLPQPPFEEIHHQGLAELPHEFPQSGSMLRDP